MKYRQFWFAPNWQCPVISCGGCAYQYSGQTSIPAEVPRDNQENLEAEHPSSDRARHQTTSKRAQLRLVGNASSAPCCPPCPAKNLKKLKIIVQTKVCRRWKLPEEF